MDVGILIAISHLQTQDLKITFERYAAMKKLMVALITLGSVSSFASNEFVNVYRCQAMETLNDSGFTELVVSAGEIAGITQATLKTLVEGRIQTNQYYVRHESDSNFVLYVGTGARDARFSLEIDVNRIEKDGSMNAQYSVDGEKYIALSCRHSGGVVNLDN